MAAVRYVISSKDVEQRYITKGPEPIMKVVCQYLSYLNTLYHLELEETTERIVYW